MEYFIKAYHTDIGIKRQTNQDSILLQEVQRGGTDVLLAVLCDGMGGMKKGELASATVVRAFGEWFRQQYVYDSEVWNIGKIQEQWGQIISDCNRRMISYEAKLGTTLTAIMIQSDGQYLIAHVGDTRAYHVSDKIEQLTEDHTFVAREVKRGNLTEEQALTDSRRNVLLQCIGVNEFVEPQFLTGGLPQGHAILLCSDGFRHEVSETEVLMQLKPDQFTANDHIKKNLISLVELNKQRKETDNISAIYMKRL